MSADSERNDETRRARTSGRAWTRRDLLVLGGQAAAAAGVAAGAAWYLHDPRGDAGLQPPTPIKLKDYFAGVDFPASSPRISTAYGESKRIDQREHVERMVQAALDGLDPQGMKRFIAKGDTVCIKPNVGFDRSPELGATTNPEVVRAVIRLCRQAGARKVIVADNPIENPAACFAKSRIKAVAEAEGASVVIHSSGHDAPVEVRPGRPDPGKGQALGTWPIFWTPLKEATRVIGVAVIKDHNLCHASMSMKNWYGLLGGRRNQFHQAIHHIISDLGFMMKPTLVVADGTRVMMKNGPTGGRLDDLRIGGVAGRPVVAASVDQLACDSWCYQNLLGRDPAALAYLDLAYEKFGSDPNRLVARSWQDYKGQGQLAETRL